MGRITIFSVDGCAHSARAKAALKGFGIPFVEISLTKHPEKLQEMISLSGKFATPQIFFNTCFVGGADETIALLMRWDADKSRYRTPLERYLAEIDRHPDPVNKRFAVPVEELKCKDCWRQSTDSGDSIVLPSGSTGSLLKVVETLKSIIPMADIRHKLTIFKNSFNALDAIQILTAHYNAKSVDVVAFLLHLQDEEVLRIVCGGSILNPVMAEPSLLRLQCHETPDVLNSYRVCRGDKLEPDCSMQLVCHLHSTMTQIDQFVTDELSGAPDLTRAVVCPDWIIFENEVCELQRVDLCAMNDQTKMAFGINVYNLMTKYAFMKVGVAETEITRFAFYHGVKFNVGGVVFTFDEWEHGVLRGNRRAPHGLSHPFAKKDLRAKLSIKSPDYRLHFALNCGAKSCPPVYILSAENLDVELDAVARAFCEDDANIKIDCRKVEVHLSKILCWYRDDFAASSSAVLRVLVQYLSGHKRHALERLLERSHCTPVRVVYRAYDWSTHATRQKTFTVSNIKANKRAGVQKMLSLERHKRCSDPLHETTASRRRSLC